MHYVLIMSGEEVLYLEWEYLMLRLLLSGGCLRGLQHCLTLLHSLASIYRRCSFSSL